MNLDALYEPLIAQGLTGHDIIEMLEGSVSNFHDIEGNYFAITD
ncbi:hypothetical protein [Mammaliicoccus vitulinus]|nr:hypothetical protein [Mammaliicoccus vitulinus]